MLDNAILTAKKDYAINFTEKYKKLCLSWQFNGVNDYLFINSVEICNLRAKNFEINAAPLFLGKVSKEFSTDNMKKTGLYQYVYEFSVYYDSIDVADILYIHKYLINKKKWIIKHLHDRKLWRAIGV